MSSQQMVKADDFVQTSEQRADNDSFNESLDGTSSCQERILKSYFQFLSRNESSRTAECLICKRVFTESLNRTVALRGHLRVCSIFFICFLFFNTHIRAEILSLFNCFLFVF